MTWTLIRTTGFVAYAFLSGAAIWGLLVSTGILGRGASPKKLTNLHESLSMAAILSTVGHLVFLYFDEFVEFGLAQLLVPGQSIWQPQAVSLGILAFYGLIVITASFYVRAKIGQKRWRLLHFASFGVWVSALAHGIMAGTDTSTVVGITLYSSTATAIVFLTVIRGYLVANPSKPSRNARPDRVNPRAGARASAERDDGHAPVSEHRPASDGPAVPAAAHGPRPLGGEDPFAPSAAALRARPPRTRPSPTPTE
jgi:hypothetical protein